MLSYNSIGQISTHLPPGQSTYSYNISLSVNIIDDTDGITVYSLPYPVTVYADNNLTYSIIESLIDTNANMINTQTTNQIMLELNSGNLNLVARNVIILTTVFNIMNSASSLSLAKLNQMTYLREFMMNKISQLSASDVSSIKVLLSALSETTKIARQISQTMAVSGFMSFMEVFPYFFKGFF